MRGIAERAAALVRGQLMDAKRLAGGSLSEVVRIKLADGRELIAKTGPTAVAEADMLAAIRATGAPAPQVLSVGDALFVMEAAAADTRLDGNAWTRLAEALARLHAATDEQYGWPVDHAFGKVAIFNTRTEDWPSFWGEQRLRCHVPHIDVGLARRLEKLADRLGGLLPQRPPASLLHGDLWGGNVLVGAHPDESPRVSLIDPACYYGDREVDVAMLTLFDHPPEHFFASLDLAAGWRDRLPVYQLWPLLVHLRLFGSGYAAQVDGALDRLGV